MDYELNCTEKGVENFSLLIHQSLEKHGMTGTDLMRACIKVKHRTTDKQIRRLLAAEYKLYPPLDLVLAISMLRIVQHPDGTPWSFEDLALVLCELIDPFKTDEKPGIAYLRLAIAIVRDIRGERSIKEFAEACGMSANRMRAIFDGTVPELMEIIKIANQSAEYDSERLAGFYIAYMQEQNKTNAQSANAEQQSANRSTQQTQQSLKISSPPQRVERACQ